MDASPRILYLAVLSFKFEGLIYNFTGKQQFSKFINSKLPLKVGYFKTRQTPQTQQTSTERWYKSL